MTTPSDPRAVRTEAYRQALRGLCSICCIFLIIIALLLAINAWRYTQIDPVQMPLLAHLKQQLLEQPGNEDLQQQVRQLDFLLRKAVFDYYAMRTIGTWLMLAAGVVMIAAIALMEWLSLRRATMPDVAGAVKHLHYGPARGGLIVTALVVAVGLGAAYGLDGRLYQVEAASSTGGQASEPEVPVQTQELETAKPMQAGSETHSQSTAVTVAPAPLPAAVVPEPQVEKTVAAPAPALGPSPWPGLRGPGGRGVASGVTPPQQLSASNLLWKTELTQGGLSSPVVCGAVVAITAGSEEGQALYGFAAEDGRLLWTVPFPASADGQVPKVDYSGWCAPSPASDGTRIFALSATGTVIAVSPLGELLWTHPFGTPQINYGFGSSLLSHDDAVYVQWDTNQEAFLAALDGASGELRWSTERAVNASWATPLLYQGESDNLVILSADPALAAYDARTGEQRWLVEDAIFGEVGPSPASYGSRVVACQEGAELICVEATTGEVLWRTDEVELPNVSSPAMSESRVYLCMSYGQLIAVNAENGELVWEHAFEAGVQASPVVVGDLVYLLDQGGSWHVFRDGTDTYEEVAVSQIEGTYVCTPAMVGKRIYLRSDQSIAAYGE